MGATVLSVDYSDHVSIKKNHYHDCHQLLFVTRGTANVYVNNAVYPVSAGNLVIFSRLEHHAVTAQSQDYQRYILDLAPDFLSMSRDGYRVYSVLFNRPAGFCNILNVQQEQSIFLHLFDSIHKEMLQKGLMHETMVELLVQQLLIFICRRSQEAQTAPEGDLFELVYQIQMQFHQNFQKPYVLKDLAQTHNISVSYLSHMFKATTGSSVMGYLQSCRIAEAKKCLAETNMRVGEIVEHCGFSDSSNFSRTFRSMTGLSPMGFRKQFHK